MSSSGGTSFYFFDIDDNLLYLGTKLYLWNAELGEEMAVSSGEFAAAREHLGRPGQWEAWGGRAETWRDFRDLPEVPVGRQPFIKDVEEAIAGDNWRGPSWPMLEHAARHNRPIAIITARGQSPQVIQEGLIVLAERGLIKTVPPIVGIYAVHHPGVQAVLGVDPATPPAGMKRLAIRHAVERALEIHGRDLPHHFGFSDDDPANVTLGIAAMRDCKKLHPDKRFFVIDTHHGNDAVKLEILPIKDKTALRV